MSSPFHPLAGRPHPPRVQSDMPDLTLPPLSSWSPKYFSRNLSISSPPPPSSSPPRTPHYHAKQTSYDYAHIRSSPQLGLGTNFAPRADHYEDPHTLWHHRLAPAIIPHTHVKFHPYPASTYLPQTSLTYRQRYSAAPSSEYSESMDTDFDDDIRSDRRTYRHLRSASPLSDKDQPEDGFSFSELGIHTMSFRTSAERGRWKTDPIPPQPVLSKTRESAPASDEHSATLIAPRTISEPAPLVSISIIPTCPSETDKQNQCEAKPEVTSTSASSPSPEPEAALGLSLSSPSLPTSPLVMPELEMEEESELPPLTSDRDSSMDVDEHDSELLTPSSPLPPSSPPPPFSSSPVRPTSLAHTSDTTDAAHAQIRMGESPPSTSSSPLSSPLALPPPLPSSPLSPISSEIGEDFDVDVDEKIVLSGQVNVVQDDPILTALSRIGSCDGISDIVAVAQDPSEEFLDQQHQQSKQSATPDLDSDLTPTPHAYDHSSTCAQLQSTGDKSSIIKLPQTEVNAQMTSSTSSSSSDELPCQTVIRGVTEEEREEKESSTVPVTCERRNSPIKSPRPSPFPSPSPVPASDRQPSPSPLLLSSSSSATVATVTSTSSDSTAAAPISSLSLKLTTPDVDADADGDEDGPARKRLKISEDAFSESTGPSPNLEVLSSSVPSISHNEEEKASTKGEREEEEEKKISLVNAKRKVNSSVTRKRRRKVPINSDISPEDDMTTSAEIRKKKPVQRRKRKYIVEESSSSSSSSDSDSDSNSDSDSDSGALSAGSDTSKPKSSKKTTTTSKTKKSKKRFTGPPRHTYPDDDGVSRDPNGIPLADGEICGMIIEGMATSRASSLPISQICRIVLQSRPAMREEKSDKEWGVVFERVLKSGSCLMSDLSTGRKAGKGVAARVEIGGVGSGTGSGSGVFGKVDSSYKDDSSSSIEARWFYVPENDCDQERAALIRSMMPRPGKRTVTKKYKQYYYQPLDKISRWDPEDDL